MVEKFSHELLEMLTCETVFTVGNIAVSESTVVTWIIMAIMVLIAILVTRDLKVENPSRRQVIVEQAVVSLQGIVRSGLGKSGERYTYYMATVLLYLGLANTIGLFGMKPPTKDLNVTVGLSIMSICLIEFAGVRAKGLKKWAKGFMEPVAVVAPINILEIFIKPVSLCMRLFGNILGAFTVMEMVKIVMPAVVPVAFGLYFDIFDGLLQAYIFVFLTSLFIGEATETEEEE